MLKMRPFAQLALALLLGLAGALPVRAEETAFRRLAVRDYVDRMTAGWIGQMVGVGWAGPTEFKSCGRIMPEEQVPEWQPELVNQFGQDDLYVEMTFLRTLERHGLDAPMRRAGIDFAASRYSLWHANLTGRDNLRSGIAPPDSGHPRFNLHADDIDYQIEADFSGLIAPGMPQVPIDLGDRFGRLMNYGDGVYGGQFVGGMYAAAFFETDPRRIVQAGLRCIPAGSQYAECVRDVLQWHRERPQDWQAAWRLVDAKYHRDPARRRFSCGGPAGEFNIDAKLNGAYIVIGLLYGERHPERTIRIATRCGQDSDCNPSNAAGVLFTTLGYEALPERFASGLVRDRRFAFGAYDFDDLVAVCEKLARQAVVARGGRIEAGPDGDVFVIPLREPEPSALVQSYEPGPVEGSRFTEAELALMAQQMIPERRVDVNEALDALAPGWQATPSAPDMHTGLRAEWNGRGPVLVTHPLTPSTGCTLSREVPVPRDKRTRLLLTVGHHPRGNWMLVVRADGQEVVRREVGEATARDGWLELSVDLSRYAGKSVLLEVVNEPTGWAWEAGYWHTIAIESR